MEQDRYPLTYRESEAQQVMAWIKAGQSGCLIGLRGAGSANILRFLAGEKARRHYLGRDYSDFLFVLTDLLALTECTEWAVCELMLDRLLKQLSSSKMEIGEDVALLYQKVVRSKELLIARHALESSIDMLCQRPAQRVIFLFSGFDVAFQVLDPSLFRCLRAIRNAHRGQVSYIVAVTSDLAYLRDDLTEVDPFYRLVSHNVCYLGPFDEADARHRIRYRAWQRSVQVSGKDTTRLIELSGGHPAMLKRILSLLWSADWEGDLERLAPTLQDNSAVQERCQEVWEGLPKEEQVALCTLAAGAQPEPGILEHLKRRGVVKDGQQGIVMFSPLFAHFVRQQLPPSPQGTIISRDSPIVQIDGRQIKDLTDLEFELLCYLYEQRGRVCTKDELIENVYRQQYARMRGGVTDIALQTLVSRLRGKIEPDRGWPRCVVTVRGEGYKFVDMMDRGYLDQ